MYPLRFYYFSIIAIICFNQVNSLRCYNCAGPLNKDLACEIDIRKETYTPCDTDDVCVKYIVNYHGTSILTRRCASKEICTKLELEFTRNTTHDLSECRSCESDLCNLSNNLIPSILICLLSLSVLFYH